MRISDWISVVCSSDLYGHAFFIVPVCLFLFYRLRHRLAALQPEPALWALGPIAILCLVWMVGALANAMVVKQFAFVGLWQALFLLILGWRITRAALFPLAYLIRSEEHTSELQSLMRNSYAFSGL